MTTLAAIILCHNEVEHIQDCVKSILFADDALVFLDQRGSAADEVARLAAAAGARIVRRPFDNYAGQRNAALEAVSADWVLFVDADERVTPGLAQEVRRVIEGSQAVGYGIPRDNYIFGKLTRHAGWYPDYQVRLLRRGHAYYDPARPVHEVAVLDGEQGRLENGFVHYNYRNLRQFIAKQRRYADIDAGILYAEGVRPGLEQIVKQPFRQFRWRFVTLQGYKDGLHGLRLCLLMAWYEWLKYRKLAAHWKTAKMEGKMQ